MKNVVRTSLAAAALSLAFLTSSYAAETEAGFVDIGQFIPSAGGQFVEVNLSQGMLKFAAKIAAHQEPEAAELINNLKRIRVNVIGMDDSNRADTVAKIESIRRKLESQGWTQLVTVRDRNDGDNVDVHVKQRGDDNIDGLVVTVIDKKGEAVFVNIVGNISAEQLGVIADKFDIGQLKHIHVKNEHKPKDKEV
jgi:hypothetical protein